jgi:hypothetical protein
MEKAADDEENEAPLEQPFMIEPASGVVPPLETVEFKLSFTPTDSIPYETMFEAVIPNLSEELQFPEINVLGEGLRPKCHFELSQSDYLLAHRRRDDMPGPDGRNGPLDPSYKVIEFKSLGTGVRNTRRFYVQTPTQLH